MKDLSTYVLNLTEAFHKNNYYNLDISKNSILYNSGTNKFFYLPDALMFKNSSVQISNNKRRKVDTSEVYTNMLERDQEMLKRILFKFSLLRINKNLKRASTYTLESYLSLFTYPKEYRNFLINLLENNSVESLIDDINKVKIKENKLSTRNYNLKNRLNINIHSHIKTISLDCNFEVI